MPGGTKPQIQLDEAVKESLAAFRDREGLGSFSEAVGLLLTRSGEPSDEATPTPAPELHLREVLAQLRRREEAIDDAAGGPAGSVSWMSIQLLSSVTTIEIEWCEKMLRSLCPRSTENSES